MNDEAFSAVIPEDDGDNDEKVKSDGEIAIGGKNGTDEFPTLAQSMEKWNLVESKRKEKVPMQCGSKDPIQSSEKSKILTGDLTCI